MQLQYIAEPKIFILLTQPSFPVFVCGGQCIIALHFGKFEYVHFQVQPVSLSYCVMDINSIIISLSCFIYILLKYQHIFTKMLIAQSGDGESSSYLIHCFNFYISFGCPKLVLPAVFVFWPELQSVNFLSFATVFMLVYDQGDNSFNFYRESQVFGF